MMRILSYTLILTTALVTSALCFDRVSFKSNKQKLAGYFFESQNESSPIVIFCQGLPGEQGDELDLGKNLSIAGINFFTFNYSGIFESEGEQGLANAQKDIQAALEFVSIPEIMERYNVDTSRVFLGGYSFGGGMALTYAQHHPEIKNVFSIAGTDHGVFAKEISADTTYLRHMQNYFKKYLELPNGPVRFAYESPMSELIQNPEPYHIQKLAPKLSNTDVLLIGGVDDGSVTLENHILPLYRVLKKNKDQKVTIKIYQTNHSFRNVLKPMADDIIHWIKTHN